MQKLTLGTRAVVSALALAAALGIAMPALGQQSPVLDPLVADGTLPPVEERLPSNPLVVEGVEGVGKYGGTWRMGMRGGGDNGLIVKTVAYEGLVRFDRDWKTVIPNLAESWEANAEATEYSFKLREGVKWSDGTPFTTADIAFTVEMYQDPDYPAGSWIDNKNNPVKLEVVDDYNFKFKFDKPNGMLMDVMASVEGTHITSLQKAYCSQFHPKYNENAAAEAEAKGFTSWALYLQDRCAWGWETIRFSNPDLPVLYAWMIEQPLSADAARVTWKRNPYYFKVDAEGNQLPYIDNVDMRVSESAEELTLLALNGEIDFQERHIATTVNKPLFFDGQEQGDYRLGEVIPSQSNTLVFQLNFSHDDPVKRELFRNKDFRIGISHAIDRQEIVDVVFTGQGEPFQVAPRPESALYDEELAKQYTEYSVEKANAALDRAGYAERNADGIRLGPDGEPISFTIEFATEFQPTWPDALELVQDYWQEVGVDVQIKPEDRTIFYERKEANQPDATVWSGDGGGKDVTIEARWYFPFSDESNFALPWAEWYYSRGESGMEPPAAAKRQMELYDELHATLNEDERARIMGEILNIAQEEFYVIGTSLPPESYGIVKNNFHNVPEMYDAALYPQPGPTNPEQYYITGE